jgi:hypothetical protein
MTSNEYFEAKEKLARITKKHKKHNFDIESYESFINYLDAVITVKGHALCMDVKDERRRASKLVAKAAYNYFKLC